MTSTYMRYPSKIVEVDLEEQEILLHFERWSSRYDEWVNFSSDRIRPVTRISTRKGHGKAGKIVPMKVGDRVMAKWSDCRKYAATVTCVHADADEVR
ncbi:PREDICTED: PHD finger protein 20-like protein 1 [Priapulus caudatus]|uniref:PHD finger protein 20-like protein 1 n=1 Tax=Priapulus caudatus TaxID=37621 RepID=A0ABM1EZ67_PRICU|nr:PREDICTED: PHD finger protein 20-like protein 1 [Priapulus caudatus]